MYHLKYSLESLSGKAGVFNIPVEWDQQPQGLRDFGLLMAPSGVRTTSFTSRYECVGFQWFLKPRFESLAFGIRGLEPIQTNLVVEFLNSL